MRRVIVAVCVVLAAVARPATAAGAGPEPVPADASAQVVRGAALFQQHCAVCHGPRGRDATVFPRPIWGAGHDLAKFGSAKGLFEYLQLLMPFDDPAKLDDAAKTAVTAYMLMRNGDLPAAQTLPTGGDPRGIRR